MSIYRCSRCGQFVDDDAVPGVEDPKTPNELMCEDHTFDDGNGE